MDPSTNQSPTWYRIPHSPQEALHQPLKNLSCWIKNLIGLLILSGLPRYVTITSFEMPPRSSSAHSLAVSVAPIRWGSSGSVYTAMNEFLMGSPWCCKQRSAMNHWQEITLLDCSQGVQQTVSWLNVANHRNPVFNWSMFCTSWDSCWFHEVSWHSLRSFITPVLQRDPWYYACIGHRLRACCTCEVPQVFAHRKPTWSEHLIASSMWWEPRFNGAYEKHKIVVAKVDKDSSTSECHKRNKSRFGTPRENQPTHGCASPLLLLCEYENMTHHWLRRQSFALMSHYSILSPKLLTNINHGWPPSKIPWINHYHYHNSPSLTGTNHHVFA